MQPVPEPVAARVRWLHDTGAMVFLALVGVPMYLLCNQYWQSLIQLTLLYGILAWGCIRLGKYVHRVMRRLPAEIPPWTALVAPFTPVWLETRFGTAEAIQNVHQDPHYVQEVLKPRLQRLLMHRLGYAPETPLTTLSTAQLAQVPPVCIDFLRRREPAGLWAKYLARQRRIKDVIEILRRLEAL